MAYDIKREKTRQVYVCLTKRSSDSTDNEIYLYLSQEIANGPIKINGLSSDDFKYEDKHNNRQVGKIFRREFPDFEKTFDYINAFSIMNNIKVNFRRVAEDGVVLKRFNPLESRL